MLQAVVFAELVGTLGHITHTDLELARGLRQLPGRLLAARGLGRIRSPGKRRAQQDALSEERRAAADLLVSVRGHAGYFRGHLLNRAPAG